MELNQQEKKKLIIALTLPVLITLIVALFIYTALLERLELWSFDLRTQLVREDTVMTEQVAVVMIDESSLKAMNPMVGRWPWPRSLFADLLEFLSYGEPKAVVFDILFSEADHREHQAGQISEHDQSLINATEEYPFVHYGVQFFEDVEEEGENGGKALPENFIQRFSLQAEVDNLTSDYSNYAISLPGLYRHAQGIGTVNFEPDEDGVYRRVRLVENYGEHYFPSLALTPFLSQRHEKIGIKGNQLSLRDLHLPIDRNGRFVVNMYGDFRPYSISGIFASLQQIRSGELENLLVSPYEFQDKIVFVGASAVGLEDIKATSITKLTPGVNLHAAIASNILLDDYIHFASDTVTLVTTFIFSLIFSFIVLYGSTLWLMMAVPLLLTGAYIAVGIWAFAQGLALDMVHPISGAWEVFVVGLIRQTFTEGRDKRRVRQMFSQYVSPAVLEELTSHFDEHISAGGGRKENLTVLFSDVRGFTGLSETLEAEKVVDLLNTYFSTMSHIIMENEGTVDKFIGDAIMAFWGAPIRITDHANKAVESALEMLRRMDDVNQTLTDKGYPSIRMGIGLNTGDVILGNIGSNEKLDYTVIGDSVNLASRVEGLCKIYFSTMLISQYTMEQLEPKPHFATIDAVRVKGKHEPILIYSPPHDDQGRLIPEERVEEEVARINQAFSHYQAQHWEEAIEGYKTIKNSLLAQEFINRCQDYQVTSPGDDWDGVYTLDRK